jgi:hypothetical protein
MSKRTNECDQEGSFPQEIEFGKRYRLSTKVADQSEKYATLQYIFKPANIDQAILSTLTVKGDTKDVELKHILSEDGDSAEFKGQLSTSLSGTSDKEFVLLYDNNSKSFKLQSVDIGIINLRFNNSLETEKEDKQSSVPSSIDIANRRLSQMRSKPKKASKSTSSTLKKEEKLSLSLDTTTVPKSLEASRPPII